MSDFSSLQTALSGLTAHQKAVQTAGHNIANAATPGYSRQRVDLKSSGAGVVPAVWSKPDGIGNGVEVSTIVRIRDQFLEARAVREVGTGAHLERLGSIMDRIEMIFPEPSDVGLAHQLSDMWASFDDVGNQPGSSAPRISLLERAGTVASELNRAATELANLHQSSVDQADALVTEVNTTAARVAELNQSVRNATAAGLAPHDLADQRDRLIDRLGELVGVTTQPGEHGTTNVFLGGTALVRGDRAESLVLDTEGDLPAPHDGLDLTNTQVRWAKDNYPAAVTSGEIAGLMEGANRAIPDQLADLDAVADTLITQVNDLHVQGFGLDGADGRQFFAGTDAATIRVHDDVAGQPDNVAAAAPDPANPGSPLGELDASWAQALAALGDAPDAPDQVYNDMIGALGVETQALHRRQAIQGEVIRQVDDAREGVRGVNIDEEMVSLVQSQHAYAASARLMTTIDEMLATLITRTGVVGR
ncbi:MAG: flagellar hook-associated protein FlgK [Acidimicrobiales bacterium]|nr:flagellar hook-associated protein FlgK [Acidimicrobiales bacterium]